MYHIYLTLGMSMFTRMSGIRKQIRISKIITETSYSKSFILETTAGNLFTYRAGQFMTFIFEGPFGEQRRNYSLSSAPTIGESPTITIKRVTNGIFSRQLIERAQPGDYLTTIGPGGFFILPGDLYHYDQLFLFAAGSGITPIFSLLKTALHNFPRLLVVLIYSNRSEDDTIFFSSLREWQEMYPGRFKIEWLFSNAGNYKRARLSNSLLKSFLASYIESPLQSCLFYMCGPVDYMRMIDITLHSAGVPTPNIHREAFTIPQLAPIVTPPDECSRSVKVTIEGNEYDFVVPYPLTILQAARKAGIELPFSCEAGRCGTCAARCVSGQVWMRSNEVLTDENIRMGLVLTCTGHPFYTDIELKFSK